MIYHTQIGAAAKYGIIVGCAIIFSRQAAYLYAGNLDATAY
jgi:hypothetical protein